jgi:competence ComEA-like helix-hairpin-helix protein
MRWCLQVKLAQNWDSFGALLLETDDLPIVEHSRRDDFWGAKPTDENTLVGTNALGRLLMELRERLRSESQESLQRVEPLGVSDFLLYGRQIEAIGQPITDTDAIQPALIESGPHPVCEKHISTLTKTQVKTELAESNVPYCSTDDDIVVININEAEVGDLAILPRIGEKLAQAIVDHRDNHCRGQFPSPQSIASVSGIGKKIYKRIANRITIGHNLL